MKIIKLGGSVVTNKQKPLSYRRDVVRRIAREIKGRGLFVIIHGGGSFGHYSVKKFGLNVNGFCYTRYYMQVLNTLIVRDFLQEGIPCTGISTISLFNDKGFNINPLKNLLNNGIIPIIFGDVIIKNNKYKVVSGDELVVEVANNLNASEIYFLVDVDGVYDKEERLIREIKLEEIDENIFYDVEDVTGGMKNKISCLKRLRRGVVYILNGLKEGNLRKLLEGKDVMCTKIIVGDYK